MRLHQELAATIASHHSAVANLEQLAERRFAAERDHMQAAHRELIGKFYALEAGPGIRLLC